MPDEARRAALTCDELRELHQLRTSEQRYEQLAALNQTFVWEVDLSGLCTYVSSAVEAILGYLPDEIVGNIAIADLVPSDDRQRFKRHFQESLANQQPFRHAEYPMTAKSGKIVWVSRNGLPALDVHGNLIGYRGTDTDITEHKAARDALANMSEQLAQSQRLEAVGLLAGGVAHDFNNLSMGLMGYAESAMEKLPAGHGARPDLLEIQRAAEHGAALTAQLLAIARQQAVHPRSLDLNEAIGSSLKLVQHLTGEDISLIWRPASDLWRVRLDPGQMGQMLSNLCLNARDATGGRGTLVIETANVTATQRAGAQTLPPGEYVTFRVTDDGRGMTTDVLNRVFDPFFTTKGVGEGTGLGLATVYGIVKQNDGYVTVTSEPGHGTTFVVSFPRYLGSDADDEASTVSSLPLGGGETVLLVEDETSVRNLATRMLERLGYRVLVAEDPVKGIATAREHGDAIDLLVTDVIMPVMTGKEMADRIAQFHQGLRVLFISGYTADVIASRGVIDADVHFLAKPFTRDALARKIREILPAAD